MSVFHLFVSVLVITAFGADDEGCSKKDENVCARLKTKSQCTRPKVIKMCSWEGNKCVVNGCNIPDNIPEWEKNPEYDCKGFGPCERYLQPTNKPTKQLTVIPTKKPTTPNTTQPPSLAPTDFPTTFSNITESPSMYPSDSPTTLPSNPSSSPTKSPSRGGNTGGTNSPSRSGNSGAPGDCEGFAAWMDEHFDCGCEGGDADLWKALFWSLLGLLLLLPLLLLLLCCCCCPAWLPCCCCPDEDEDDCEIKISKTFYPGHFGWVVNSKGYITKIHRGGQAERAGVKVGWQILEVGEWPDRSTMDSELTILKRGSKDFNILFCVPPTVTRRSASSYTAGYSDEEDVASNMTKTFRAEQFGWIVDSQGYITKIHPGGQAEQAGVEVGWQIVKVGRWPAKSTLNQELMRCRNGSKDFEIFFCVPGGVEMIRPQTVTPGAAFATEGMMVGRDLNNDGIITPDEMNFVPDAAMQQTTGRVTAGRASRAGMAGGVVSSANGSPSKTTTYTANTYGGRMSRASAAGGGGQYTYNSASNSQYGQMYGASGQQERGFVQDGTLIGKDVNNDGVITPDEMAFVPASQAVRMNYDGQIPEFRGNMI